MQSGLSRSVAWPWTQKNCMASNAELGMAGISMPWELRSWSGSGFFFLGSLTLHAFLRKLCLPLPEAKHCNSSMVGFFCSTPVSFWGFCLSWFCAGLVWVPLCSFSVMRKKMLLPGSDCSLQLFTPFLHPLPQWALSLERIKYWVYMFHLRLHSTVPFSLPLGQLLVLCVDKGRELQWSTHVSRFISISI